MGAVRYDFGVTVAGNVRGRDGVRVHRVGELHPHDVTNRDGLRVTTPARTLIDLAAQLPASELERAIEEAQVQRLITPTELSLLPSRSSNTRGTRRLKQALESAREPSLTRSEAERRLLDLIRAARLPHPRTNARVCPRLAGALAAR